ncbi:MAG: hypothetical protein M1830_010092 [Pleopsidium flavum]|nr:MAG: hypothetical protein M1830_010092 [Pleopsidium flavum]
MSLYSPPEPVYEQSRSATELGAAVILAPNAHGIMKRLGIDLEKDGAVSRQWHTEYTSSGQRLALVDLMKTAGLWQHSGILCRRIAIHNSLKIASTSPEGDGPPVKLHTKARVADVDVDSSTLLFEDGSKVSGDCIIGADGVKSITRTKVHDTKPFPSGKSAYRFLVERSKALCNPLTADLVSREGDFSIWYGRDRRIWMYTTQFNELLNFVCMHPDSLSEVSDSKEAFGEAGNKADNKANMMEIFKDFDPRVLALLELAEPPSVRLWQLYDMDPPPTRLAGKLCLLGDAALPFLPHIGQGAACAIEDAASLAAILLPGTSCADIPEMLQFYEECRKDRAEKIHSFSRLLGHDLEPGNEDARINRARMTVEFFPYIFTYDEHNHTTQKFRQLMYEKSSPHWSMPTAFGPMPGPRQTFYGRKDDASSYVRSSVKFKSSRTLLKNLLPGQSVIFAGPGSIALASFSHTAFSNVSWLGGRGYDEFAFYIHGVQCTKLDGSSLPGSFLAVLFVNSADAIASDREDLGIPKVFCDLQAQRKDSGYTLKASWQGTQFAEMQLHDLAESVAEPSEREGEADPVFVRRYIPALGNKGKAIADCIVCLPSAKPSQSTEERKRGAANADIKWTTRDGNALPTLHQIVARLAEVPIFEVVKATVTEGLGMPEYDNAYVVRGLEDERQGNT